MRKIINGSAKVIPLLPLHHKTLVLCSDGLAAETGLFHPCFEEAKPAG